MPFHPDPNLLPVVTNGSAPSTPASKHGHAYRDVWQSNDGVEWRQISTNMPDSGETILLFKDQMWLLDAQGVFSSPDGNTWRQHAAGKPFANLGGYGAAVFDGRMWIFGGIGREKKYWFSLNTPKALANFSPGLEQER